MANEKEPQPTLFTRRNAITKIAWSLVGASSAVSFAAGLSALFPRVRPTPATRVVLGRPEEFSVGEVSERFKKQHRLFLVRNEDGFYALRSVCTHLGCVPGWQAAQHKFKCFCHGSGFHIDGVNFEGPAPRPLDRLQIALDPGGRIVVDTAKLYRSEALAENGKDAFLPWKSRA